jgi:flagellar biosynthetic protein FliO
MGATFFAFARTLLVLGLVVGLLVGLARVARRLQGRPGASGGRIEVVSRRPLGKNVTLLVVRIAHRTFLLGQSAQQLTLLAEFEGAEWVAADAGALVGLDKDQLAPRTVRAGTGNTPTAWDAFIDHLREMTVRR